MAARDAYARACAHLECAVAGLKGAADSLHAAAALLAEAAAGLDSEELQTHAAVTRTNAASLERLGERSARLLAKQGAHPEAST
jgi:hypothetical protein